MIKIFLICSGLGNIQRGFEAFYQDCFNAFKKSDLLDTTLFKGGGQSSRQSITLPNFPRQGRPAQLIGKLTGKGEYYVEQFSFALSLLPYLQSKKPQVIYFSDRVVGNTLWYWRRLTKQNYKLLFHNGAPASPDSFGRWNHVHQVTPLDYQEALESGVPEAKQSLIPMALSMSDQLEVLSDLERENLRLQLKLPEKRPIILSVGAVNTSHKRMDYVIREIASLPKPRPYLLILGQQYRESANVINLGNQLLGSENFSVRTVAANQVVNYY